MGKRLLLVGGGHAHMMVLSRIAAFIEKGYEVIVIGPSVFHYYSGMGAGMLGKTYRPEEIRFATKHLVEKQGGKFVLGKVVSVDPEKKILHLASDEKVAYDVVSFNAGSHVPLLPVEGNFHRVYPVKPIEKLKEAQEEIEAFLEKRPVTIGVIGGGPSAAEIAGNVWRLSGNASGNKPKVCIFSAGGFMRHLPEPIRKRAAKSLTKRGIQIFEHAPVREIGFDRVIMENGESRDVDFIFLALGVIPSGIFKTSGLPTGPEGGLLVNSFLQNTTYPDIFGGGDCIYFQNQPLDKVGVYAVRENPVLLHNLMARLDGAPLKPFDPGGDYLLIYNMGDGTGIFHKKWLTFDGKPAFLIKDYIDRKFMRNFQKYE